MSSLIYHNRKVLYPGDFQAAVAPDMSTATQTAIAQCKALVALYKTPEVSA